MRFTTPLMALMAALLVACGPSTEIIDTIDGSGSADDTEQVTPDDTGDGNGLTFEEAPLDTFDTGDDVVYEDLDQDGWTGEFDCNDSPLDEDGDGRVDGYWINPDQPESCNNIDDDCNGQIDDGLDTTEQWPDLDGDGYGDYNAESELACASFPGMSDNNLDCNDENDSVNPDAEEIVGDGIDSDCDELTAPGETDTGETEETDVGDDDDSADTGDTGSGDDDDSAGTDEVPVDDDADGFTEDADCDDTDAAINPDAIEYDAGIDGIDNNCDGSVDEDWQATAAITYNSYVAGAFNTVLYSDGATPNQYDWQEKVEAVDGTSAQVEYLSNAWDISAQCGLVINGEGSSQPDLCYGGVMDPDFTLEVWWLGTSYDQDDLTVWIADADDGNSCALILQVDSDPSCDPIDDVIDE